MVVDGTVFMVENILRHGRQPSTEVIIGKIATAVHEVQRPVFFAGSSSSRLTCQSLRCSGWKAGSFDPWPGRSRLHCWER